MKPSPGRIVLFRSATANGQDEHPAIVTRVWSDTCVNLVVFLDNVPIPLSRTSVVQNEDLTQGDQLHAWRWPPRVAE